MIAAHYIPHPIWADAPSLAALYSVLYIRYPVTLRNILIILSEHWKHVLAYGTPCPTGRTFRIYKQRSLQPNPYSQRYGNTQRKELFRSSIIFDHNIHIFLQRGNPMEVRTQITHSPLSHTYCITLHEPWTSPTASTPSLIHTPHSRSNIHGTLVLWQHPPVPSLNLVPKVHYVCTTTVTYYTISYQHPSFRDHLPHRLLAPVHYAMPIRHNIAVLGVWFIPWSTSTYSFSGGMRFTWRSYRPKLYRHITHSRRHRVQ